MTAFPGFPPGPSPYVPLPETFFSAVLPEIEDINELKVTLHLFNMLYRKQGMPRCASDRELQADATLRRALRRLGDPRPHEERLRAALEAAVVRGTLLRVRVRVDDEVVSWYFFNTERSRHAIESLLSGALSATTLLDLEEPHMAGAGAIAQVEAERANIYTLYEQNVGLLLPMVAEELREASERYPAEWLEEAFREAVRQNRRRWSYIRAILRRWETEGKAG
ncbi:MAG TPA: DnaD domain protein [Ktedonobacterales bacterium]